MFSGVLSLTIAFKKDQKSQNICELVSFVNWSVLMKQNTIFSDLGATGHLKLNGPT